MSFSVTPTLVGIGGAWLVVLAFLPAEAGVTMSFSVTPTLVGIGEAWLVVLAFSYRLKPALQESIFVICVLVIGSNFVPPTLVGIREVWLISLFILTG